MIVCPRCEHRNPEGSNFCSSCGSALSEDHTESLPLLETPIGEEGDVEIVPGDVPAGAGLLIVRHGPNAGSRYVVAGTLTAGRHPDSDIFLDDITVSRRHAEIAHDADAGSVLDVGSLNGTYVNRERVERSALTTGDELQIGRYRFEYFEGPPSDE